MQVCGADNIPKTKLSGLKICPKGPERTESIVPGSRSTKMALGTYFPPGKTKACVKNVLLDKTDRLEHKAHSNRCVAVLNSPDLKPHYSRH